MSNFMLPAVFSDVSLLVAPVPAWIAAVSARGVLWQVAPGSFLLNLPDIARYLVTSGRTVTIAPVPGASTRVVERFLRMTPLAALLYQRGICAFHAAVVADARGAVLLAGESGVGKSTLMTTLLQRGWTMLSDDLAIVDINEDGKAIVHPTYPEIALWPDTLDKLGIDSKTLPCYDANRREYSRPEQFETVSRPLQAIYWLDVHNKNDCELAEIEGSTRFSAIGMLQYNSHIADALCDRGAYMRCAATLARSVPICRLRRPRGAWSLGELADMVEKHHPRYAAPAA